MTPTEELDLARARDIDAILGPVVARPERMEFALAGRADLCARIARAIRLGDEARGLRVVPEDGLNQVRAVLAQYLSAGHNNPGPTHEDIDKAFWLLDAWLAASPFAPEEKP